MALSGTTKLRLALLGIVVLTVLAGFFVYPKAYNQPADWFQAKTAVGVGHFWNVPFRLGLDLLGGTHLVYQADVSQVPSGEISDAVEGVRDVIERRVNAFGVAEPVVQVSGSGTDQRIVVELAGVKDVNQAIAMIGETPLLEFKEQATPQPLTAEQQKSLDEQNKQVQDQAKTVLAEVLNSPVDRFSDLAKQYSQDGSASQGGDLGWAKRGVFVPEFEKAIFDDLQVGQITPQLVQSQFGYHIIYKEDQRGEGDNLEVKSRHILFRTASQADLQQSQEWAYTGLTGKQLKTSYVQFDPNSGLPNVGLEFNDEGKQLFGDITGRNVGQMVGIFLDGQAISLPRVNEAITEGTAVITGDFSIDEAKTLVRRLNAGALPVPINLISQQTVGATLGADSLAKSLFAGLIGLLAVALFMIVYYRLPGVLSVVALMIYAVVVLGIFKLFGFTLTLTGIAGFILSLGMAVDANVLIFERIKEELRGGRPLGSAVDEGFKRAWPSIRDSNASTLITCSILFWFTTSLVKGFALTLGLGVIISMFTAIIITRSLLKMMVSPRTERWHFLWNQPSQQ